MRVSGQGSGAMSSCLLEYYGTYANVVLYTQFFFKKKAPNDAEVCIT